VLDSWRPSCAPCAPVPIGISYGARQQRARSPCVARVVAERKQCPVDATPSQTLDTPRGPFVYVPCGRENVTPVTLVGPLQGLVLRVRSIFVRSSRSAAHPGLISVCRRPSLNRFQPSTSTQGKQVFVLRARSVHTSHRKRFSVHTRDRQLSY
jgi:hypothetical protein